MESQSNLETSGNLQINPFAELLAEVSQIKLNGSLRVARETQKIAVYFDAGEVVFAASNARPHRLFEVLLQAGRVTKDQLVTIPEFTNDLALKEYLLKFEPFEEKDFDALSSTKIFEILKTALAWRQGDWTFSPLVRIKGDIRFSLDLRNTLLDYSRNLPTGEAARKLTNPQESFGVKSATLAGINLSPRESFVFSRFENANLTIEEIQRVSGLPDAETQEIIYTLWLGGLLVRKNWNAAFSERKISAILAARLSLKKEEETPPLLIQPTQTKAAAPFSNQAVDNQTTEENAAAEKTIALDDYLTRTENAVSSYEIFAVAPDAATAEIKQIYFGLAKRFHPDLHRKEADINLFERIQKAFTKLARAYETLKDADARDLYDFKMRKELAEIKAAEQAAATYEEIDTQKQHEQAAENFAQGFNLLMDGDSFAALPFLARAVHFFDQNARYHAYYGKALAADNKQRHKAEGELQTAVKLDKENADYRIMLAEFFISFSLLKRAEGELNRLLEIFPNHREAKSLLDSLPKK